MVMESEELVWNNGKTTPWTCSPADRQQFKRDTGAQCVTAFRWQFGGLSHEVAGHVAILPDHSGIVTDGADNGRPERLSVINADGSLRFLLQSPLVVPGPVPRGGPVHLELPISRPFGSGTWFAPTACFLANSSWPVLLDVDWTTGELRGAEPLPPWA